MVVMLKVTQNSCNKKSTVILLEIHAAFVWFKYVKEDLEIFKMQVLFVIFWAHKSVNQGFAKFGKILVWISDQVAQQKLTSILKAWYPEFKDRKERYILESNESCNWWMLGGWVWVYLRISLPPSVEWGLVQVQQSWDGRKTDTATSLTTTVYCINRSFQLIFY